MLLRSLQDVVGSCDGNNFVDLEVGMDNEPKEKWETYEEVAIYFVLASVPGSPLSASTD